MNFILKKDLAILLLRIAFGFRLIYGTFDNIIDWNQMLEFEHFLAAKGFPFPLVCAVTSVYVQFLAGLSWIIGFKVKWTSLFMIFNFLVAVVAIHLSHGDDYLNTAPALHLLVVAIFLYFTGPGRYALDKEIGQTN